MSSQIKPLLLIVLATVFIATTGCSGTFQANIANQSSHPVTVKLTYTKWYGGKQILLSQRVAPGDAARLGPIDAPRSGARLEAHPEGIAAPRAAVNISSGETTAHVIGVFLDRGIPGVDWRIIETDPN
jgi:hypothetical protein